MLKNIATGGIIFKDESLLSSDVEQWSGEAVWDDTGLLILSLFTV